MKALVGQMASELPEYLRSLEEVVSPGLASVAGPAAAQTFAPPKELSGGSATGGTPLSLSSIGFGNLFTGASLVAATGGGTAATDKTKVLLVSTHVHQVTGYSKVSYGILNEMAKHPWLQVTHFGFQRFHQETPGFRPYPSSVEVIDAVSLEKPVQQGFGYQVLPEVIRKKQPHVVILYNDMAVVTRFIEEIRKSGIPRNFQLWVYCDQVYPMQLQAYIDILNRDADRVFAFTPYWRKCLKEQGVTRPIDVLPHGFSARQFFPVPRELARKQLQLPADLFLFLNMNRNQPRKRYDILLMAFVELIVKYPTKPIHLLCVCDKGEKGGWWLFEIYQRELRKRGVPVEQYANRLILTSRDMSFRDEEINLFYNAADVGISTADGEGWGLCQFEQMGVGVPQVVPDVGGFKEFCTAENSVIVKPKVRYYLPTGFCPVGGEAEACDPHDVCLGMEEFLLDSARRESAGKAAKEKVLTYTWERCTETLMKRLKAVKEDTDD